MVAPEILKSIISEFGLGILIYNSICEKVGGNAFINEDMSETDYSIELGHQIVVKQTEISLKLASPYVGLNKNTF